VCDVLGLPVDGARIDVNFSPLREEVIMFGAGVLINDCYNANPLSMRAALFNLAAQVGGRKIAVLGEMAELGAEAPLYHREIGELIVELGLDHVIAVGDLARGYLEGGADGRWVATADEAADALMSIRGETDIVLVKGSRSVGLEAVAAKLSA
jgi:UDP-N-acetylmuramoyl-tripeptide--D-alanyl-D-alanine ligase